MSFLVLSIKIPQIYVSGYPVLQVRVFRTVGDFLIRA